MKTRKQKETGEKEVHLLEQKGYEKMVNEIVPVQQAEAYRKPTNKAVKEAVKELNPDTNSLGRRGEVIPLLPRLIIVLKDSGGFRWFSFRESKNKTASFPYF